ncbi:hypothetical protein ACFYXH_08745 [Streptomyces sp. NPDC002730]|uniref:hypothetical protein n=1 Tax=Streptomyces sp. NPDC002730 TaxID=3364662 RepID=UPI0036AAC825
MIDVPDELAGAQRARAWTLGRVLQNSLWHVQDGKTRLQAEQVSIGRNLLAR